MSPYTEGQDELARDVLEVLNSSAPDADKLARIRTFVEDCLPSPPPAQLPWTDTGTIGFEEGRPYDPRD